MKLFFFLSLIIPLNFIAGWLFLDSLTVNPVKIFLTVFIFTLLLSLNLLVLVLAIKAGYVAFPVILGVVFFISGYLINTKIFLSRKDNQVVGEISRKGDGKNGHTAVVYFTHGEPETYNPIGWLNQFREFDEQGVRFIPFFARPAFIYMLRKKYLEVGKSNHRQGHIQMLGKLEDSFRQEGDSTTRFYISFLDDYPHPDSAVVQALNEGAERIVVSTVFLTMSNHTAEGRKLVEKLDCKNKYGVDIKFTEPLWNSETLMRAFIDKVYKHIGNTPKEKVAVALIGHGQPSEWDKEWPTLTEQEISFREGIIELLVKEGFSRENLGNAWMEFKDPKPYDLMQNFVKNGVEKVFYFASAISADAIHSQSDIPELVNKYPFPGNIEVINLGAWNAHPLVIKAIRERIDIRLSELDSTKKVAN
jgi:protoheme ferro-lyase